MKIVKKCFIRESSVNLTKNLQELVENVKKLVLVTACEHFQHCLQLRGSLIENVSFLLNNVYFHYIQLSMQIMMAKHRLRHTTPAKMLHPGRMEFLYI